MRSGVIIALAVSATLTGAYLVTMQHEKPLQNANPAADTGPLPLEAPTAELREDAEPAAAIDRPADSTVAPGDCTPQTRYVANEDGTATPLIVCESDAETVRHEYETFPTDALNALAWSDATAAEVLGMRLRESDEAAALSLTLRAAALGGGNPEPILRFSNAYPGPTSIDGELVRKTVHTKYVLGAVAEMLGAGPNTLPYWEAQIRQVSTDPERELDLLRQRAEQLLREMQQIELDVTGESTFGGQSDA